MKTEFSINDVIDLNDQELAFQFFHQNETNFAKCVESLSLNRSRDFRHADLSLIDLTDSDLRGFDFTGSDLRGAIGANVRWDETTILADADLSESIFAYATFKKKFFSENPDALRQATLLARDYWANTIIRVGDLLEKHRDRQTAIQIAKATFEESKDTTVRSDILMLLASATSKTDTKAFIYHLIATSSEKSVVRSALTTLSRLYLHDTDGANVLINFLSHPDPAIQLAALHGVLSSKHLLPQLPKIIGRLADPDKSYSRRLLLGKLAQKVFDEESKIANDDRIKNFIDYAEPLNKKRIEALAHRSSARFTLAERQRLSETLKIPADSKPSAFVKSALEHLQERFGLPFALTD